MIRKADGTFPVTRSERPFEGIEILSQVIIRQVVIDGEMKKIALPVSDVGIIAAIPCELCPEQRRK
jgi:hypothetical protein